MPTRATAAQVAASRAASPDAQAIAASRSPATPALTAAATSPVNMAPTTLSSLASGVGIGGGGPPISSQNPYSLAYLAANGIGNYLGTFYDPMDKTSGSAYFSAYQNPLTGAYYFAPGSASGSAAMIWPYGDPVMGFGPGSLSGQGQPAGYINPSSSGAQYAGGAGGLGAGSVGGFSPAGGLAGLAGLGAPSGGTTDSGTTAPGSPGSPGSVSMGFAGFSPSPAAAVSQSGFDTGVAGLAGYGFSPAGLAGITGLGFSGAPSGFTQGFSSPGSVAAGEEGGYGTVGAPGSADW